LTHFPFSAIFYLTYLTGVVDCFGFNQNTMPEIKPVEPDPDNAGVGNNKTKVVFKLRTFVQSSWVKNPVYMKNFRSVP
jgi:hypothetical protein